MICASRVFRLASFGLTSCLLVTGLAWANTANLMGIKFNTADNQVVITLSGNSHGTLLSPYEKGQRKLILDITDASLAGISDKKALIKQIQAQLPDITQISMDEFQGSVPMVRITMQTRKPDITGALIQNDNGTLILQLLNQPMTVTESTAPAAGALQYPTPESTTVTLPADTVAPKILTAKTSVDVLRPDLDRKTLEAEMLRKQRNHSTSQVASLKSQIDDQQHTIQELKRQEQILSKPVNIAPEKHRIKDLDKQLADLQKSYGEIKSDDIAAQLQVRQLQDQLHQTQDQLDTLMAKNAAALTSNSSQTNSPESRGALLNTLADLNTASVNKLIGAEKSYREGRKQELSDNLDKAVTSYEAALQAAPQVKDYALALSQVYINQKRYLDAQTVLQNALVYHPDDFSLLNELGKVDIFEKREGEALNNFRRAMPTGVLSNYASMLRRANRLSDAEAVYKLAIGANPTDSDLQYNLGNLYLSQKRYLEAQKQFDEAIQLNPNFAEARFHLGLIYAQQGKSQLAIGSFEGYLKLLPNAPNKDQVQKYIQDLQKIVSNHTP